jgi:glycosyltransferase involved in cell wall biosynthesis
MFDVCRSLAQRGHQVTLLYSKPGNLLEEYRDFGANIVQIKDWSVYPKKPLSTMSFVGNVWDAARHLKLSDRNSLIYLDDYRFSLFSSALARFRNIPSVLHLRYRCPEVFHRQHRLGLKGTRQFIAVSDRTKSEWASTGLISEKKIGVIYNGINPDLFKPAESFLDARKAWNLPERARVITYLGRIDQVKGIETLIEACALLRRESGIDVKLLIAGNPVCHGSIEEGEKYLRFLKQLSTQLEIDKHVEFLGHVTNTPSLYQASDVTVLPSVYSEPFGRTIIESMACGVPMLASRIGGIPEVLTGEFENNLFQPGNERELFVKLNEIVNWRDVDRNLGNRCRAHVLSNFTLERTIDNIEKFFLNRVFH